MAFFKSLDSITHSVMTPKGHYLMFNSGKVLKVDDVDDIAFLEVTSHVVRCTAVGEYDQTDGVKPLSYSTIGDPAERPQAPKALVVEKKAEKKKSPKKAAKKKSVKKSSKKKDQNDVDK